MIALALVCLSSNSFASSDQRKAHIKRVESAYQAIKTFSATFTQSTFIPMLEKNITRTGELALARGGKIRIEYEAPEDTIYLSDGEKLNIFQKGNLSTLREFDLDDEALPKEALSFLSGFDELTKHYNVTHVKPKTTDERKSFSLKLVPKKNQHLTHI